MTGFKMTNLLKRVLKAERESSRATSEHSQTGADPEEVVAAVEAVEAVVPSVEEDEEPATKRPRIEGETDIVVFDPSNAAYKLFREKGAVEPRLSKEATDLTELPYEPGKLKVWWPETIAFHSLKMGINFGIPYALPWKKMSFYDGLFNPRRNMRAGIGYGNPDAADIRISGDNSSRDPNPLKRHFQASSSLSLDATGQQKLVDTLMDFSGAERALGGGVSFSEVRDQGPEMQAEVPITVQEEEETCSAPAEEIAAEAIAAEINVEEIAPMVGESVPAPLLLITAAGEPEEAAPVSAEEEEPTVAIIPETPVVGGGDLSAPAAVDTPLVPPAGGSYGIVPPGSPPRSQPTLANIEYIVEKILMKRLSNNWSLDAYRKRIDDTVARSKENQEASEKLTQSLAAVKDTTVDLWESSAGQDVISTRLREDITVLNTGQELALEQILDLQNQSEKTAAEVSSNQGEIKSLVLNHASYLEKHDIEHRAINARLSSLEELRRFDNLSRGVEKTAEYSHAFMAGFQKCCEVLIAQGAFPRRMLRNPAFMDLVKDRDVLLQKLAEKDSQFSTIGESSQQQQTGQYKGPPGRRK